MLDGEIIKVGWIVVVAPDKQDPVVRLGQAITIAFIDVLIIIRLLKTKATVTGNYNQRVCQSLLNATLMDKLIEIAVDIATDD